MTGDAIGAAVELACRLEAGAPKPGNVSPGRPFADATYEQFVASAEAIRAPMAGAGLRPLGATIRLSIEATARRAGVNTNLGIVLLLAPLARAAALAGEAPAADVEGQLKALRATLGRVLEDTTVEDARQAYRAIRQAKPGGLGSADEQDVSDEPTATLLEAMRLAAARDAVAREYATVFETTFERAVPALLRGRTGGLAVEDAVVEAFLRLLAFAPDTHIVRRAGEARAVRASTLAARAIEAGSVRTAAGRRAIVGMDAELRDPGHLGNPGATADLVAAALFVAIIVGGWTVGSEHLPAVVDQEVS